LLEPHLLQAGTSLLSPGIVEMSDAQNVPDEEVFGPLLCVWRYDNFNEAIALANNTRYGLACGLISPDREQLTSCCWRVPGSSTGINRSPVLRVLRLWRRGRLRQPSPQRLVCRRLLRLAYGQSRIGRAVLPQSLSPGLDFSREATR
jgi:succinylglutamic semialdehyde dehydrogenase